MGDLFDVSALVVVPVVGEESLSVGRRRTVRQLEQVRAGVHPLLATLRAPDTRLHPRASTAASRDDRRGLPFTCGSCSHLASQGGTSGTYLKCAFGDGARVTRGPGTDVRGWWPACRDYSGGKPDTP